MLSRFSNKGILNRALNRSLVNALWKEQQSTEAVNKIIETPHSKELKMSYACGDSSKFHLLYDTVGGRIDKLAEQVPNNEAYKFCLTQTTFKYYELKQRVDELAQSFLNMGFVKGDRLALLLPNMPELAVSLLAAASIGLIAVIMNPAYQLVEIEYMLKKTKAKGIIMLDNLKTLQHYEILKKICPELENSTKGELNSKNLPELKHVIVANNRLMSTNQKYNGTWSYAEIEKFGKNKVQTPYVDPEDPFVMLFTSGTTGFPKGAVSSHFSLLNTSYLDIFISNLVDASKSIAVPIPIFHSFGLVGGILEPLIIGGKGVFPHFFPETLSLMKAIQTEKCTAIKGAPVIFNDLINHPERKNFDLSSLQYMLIGASTVPKDLILKIKNDLKVKHVIIGYGMTETAAGSIINRAHSDEKYLFNSIGLPLPFTECKIVDKDGQIVPVNTDGQICVRGYNIMMGYWDEPVKTAETIDQNGWLLTGDVGSMDETGHVFFKSRAKEVIIRGGTNIYPAEVEAFMRTNDKIFDAYCFGIEDKRIGEEVCIWVKLKPDAQLTKEELVQFCNGKIAFYKIPKYVKFVDSFPISPNGKVQKFKMQDQMRKELNL